MIRTLKFICHDCGKEFAPQGEVYYREDFMDKDIRDTEFVCPECIRKWHEFWRIASAEFHEQDYNLYVTITLENGKVFENLDAQALDGAVACGEDIPPEAQEKLFGIYKEWYLEKQKNTLANCYFNDEFMRSTFTCETYGGERYENVAFRFNMQGKLETEKPIPDYIEEQLITAWKIYQNQNN